MSGGDRDVSAQTTDIEVVNVGVAKYSTAGSKDKLTLDTSVMTGLQKVIVKDDMSAAANGVKYVIDNLAAGVATGVSGGKAGAEVTVNYKTTSGTTDEATFSVENTAKAGTVTIAGIETVTVSATGTKNEIAALTAAAAKTLKVTGAGAVSIADVSGSTVLTTIDASTNTGGVTVGAAAATINDAVTKVVGGTGNDSFTFTASRVASTDTIDGGDGTDTINLVGGSLGEAHANIKGFEVLAITDTGASYDVSKLSASTITEVKASSTGGAVGVSNLTTQSVSLSGDAPTTVTLAAKDAKSTLSVTLDNGTGKNTDGVDVTTLTTTNVKTLNLASNDTNNSLTGTNTNSAGGIQAEVVTVNATAATELTFTGTKTKSIDGSASTAALTITASSAYADATSKVGVSVKTGSGNDTITTTAQNDTIVAGAGNDTVNLSDGNDSIDLGAGNDKLVIASADWATLTADDTIAGGDGTDTISITAAATQNYNLSGAYSAKISNVSSIEKIELNVAALTNTEVATLTIDDATLSAAGNALTLAVKDNDLAVTTTAADINAGSVVLSNGTITLDGTGFDSILKYTGGNAKENITGGTAADVFTYATTAYLSANDVIKGGAGGDTIVFSQSSADKTITAAQLAGVQSVGTINLDGVDGANTNKTTITLSAAVATAMAESGTLTIKSVNAAGAADDTGAIKVDGTLVGTDVGLVISGALGADTLIGGAGNDVITSLKGSDTVDLSAGGVDKVNFLLMTQNSGGADTIKGFTLAGTGSTAATGADVIQFAVKNSTDATNKGKVFTTDTSTYGFQFHADHQDVAAGGSEVLTANSFAAVTSGTTVALNKVSVISGTGIDGNTPGNINLGATNGSAIVVFYNIATQRAEISYAVESNTTAGADSLTLIGVLDGKSLSDLAGLTIDNFAVYGV